MFENLDFFRKEKGENDIYDVMKKRMSSYNKDLLLLLPKLTSFVVRASKLKENGKDVEKIEKDLYNIVKTIVPMGIESANYAYELYNDIDRNVGSEKLLERVRETGKSELDFAVNYNKKKNEAYKLLAIFAILKNAGITLEDFNDSEIAIELMSGKSMEDVIADKFKNLPYDSEEALEEALDKTNDYSDLSPETHELTEEYHKDYMETYIYPFVSDTNTKTHNEERLLKLAFKFKENRN